MARKKIDAQEVARIKAQLGDVLDMQGNKAGIDDEFVEQVEFEARNRKYKVAVLTNAYSTADVISFDAESQADDLATKKSEARKMLDELVEDYPVDYDTESRDIKRLIKRVHEVSAAVPQSDRTADPVEAFRRQAKFLMIGAIAWNVPDIELSEQGLLDGDYRVTSAAVTAIMSALNPTSTVATEPENQPENGSGDAKI